MIWIAVEQLPRNHERVLCWERNIECSAAFVAVLLFAVRDAACLRYATLRGEAAVKVHVGFEALIINEASTCARETGHDQWHNDPQTRPQTMTQSKAVSNYCKRSHKKKKTTNWENQDHALERVPVSTLWYKCEAQWDSEDQITNRKWIVHHQWLITYHPSRGRATTPIVFWCFKPKFGYKKMLNV